jgi:hypothetical protein
MRTIESLVTAAESYVLLWANCLGGGKSSHSILLSVHILANPIISFPTLLLMCFHACEGGDAMICFLDSTAVMVPKYTGIGLESNKLPPRLL